MRVIDISVPLKTLKEGMHVYPGDAPYFASTEKTIHKDRMRLSRIEIGSHNGTHIDVPAHYIEGGAETETLPLEMLVGPAWVADLTGLTMGTGITVEHLEAAMPDTPVERLLLKTRNSVLWTRDYFQPRFVFLTPEAAEWLVEKGVRSVGIDYLSIERFGSDGPKTHLAILGANGVIMEGLDLTNVEAGREYTLAFLPLKTPGLDGAPARAVLIADDG